MNSYRSNIAVSKNISNVRRLNWSDSYSKFAQSSLDYNLFNVGGLCYSLGDSNYGENELIINIDYQQFEQHFNNSIHQMSLQSVLNSTESYLIGCGATKMSTKKIHVKCLVNHMRIHATAESNIFYGSPCSFCQYYHGKCDIEYPHLCASTNESTEQIWLNRPNYLAHASDDDSSIQSITKSLEKFDVILENPDSFLFILLMCLILSALIIFIIMSIIVFLRNQIVNRLRVSDLN